MTEDEQQLLQDARQAIALAEAAGRAGSLDRVAPQVLDRVIFDAVRIVLNKGIGAESGEPTAAPDSR